MRTLFIAFILALSATAQAGQPKATANHYFLPASTNDYNLLEGVALNATAATRTITLNIGDANGFKAEEFTKIRVSVFFTWAAATTVTAQFSCAEDGTNYARLTTRSCSSGTCTVSLQSDSYATGGASADFSLEYDVRGCQKVKILFGGAGAGATDLVNVQATAIAGV